MGKSAVPILETLAISCIYPPREKAQVSSKFTFINYKWALKALVKDHLPESDANWWGMASQSQKGVARVLVTS